MAAKCTGQPAEDGVRELPGITRAAIRAHEDMADTAFIAAGLRGALALGTTVRWRRTPIPNGAVVAARTGTLGVAPPLMAYTGLLGRQVRHTHVRRGATAVDALVIEPARARPSPASR